MEAPSLPLIEQIVAKLEGSDGNHLGTAVVVSPTIALTAAVLVDNHQEYLLSMALEPGPTSPYRKSTTIVVARDDALDVAILEFDSALALTLPMNLLAPEEPEKGTSWEIVYASPFDGPAPVPVRISGTFQGFDFVYAPLAAAEKTGPTSAYQKRKMLRLAAPESEFGRHPYSSGAPVMVNDQIVGLISGVDRLGYPYAIPVTEMVKSPALKLLAAAMQAPAAAATKDEQPMPQFLVTAAGLNLRQGPSTSAAVIGELPANSVVEKWDESADKGWFYVSSEKNGAAIEGWVAARFLKLVDGPTAAPPSTAQFDGEAFLKRLGESALTALAHANGIRISRKQPKMHMDHLIAGLFWEAGGPTRKELERAGIDENKLSQVVGQVEVVLPPPGSYSPLLITDDFPSLSAHVEQALVEAVALADSNESLIIGSRHLIRGALSVSHCSVIRSLLRAGVDPEKIPLDDQPSPQSTPRRPTQAGIKSDDPDGEDLLDIKQEVEALCTVLASKDVKPPISLGLFGDWGSGKSFFMKKMEARFNKLQEIARQEDSAYCSNIVQLWFNAWHYMDTNLWASLATEIFDELAQELARQDAIAAGRDPDYERAQLVAKRADANQEVAKANQVKLDADAKLRASRQQLESIRSGETEVAMDPQAVLREGYRLAVQQPEVRGTVDAAKDQLNAKVAEAARTLNIAPADSAKAQLLELQGLWGYLRALVLAVRNTNKTRLTLMLGVFLVVSISAIWVLPEILAMIRSLNWIHVAWVRASGLVVAVLAAIAPFIPVARRAVQILHDAVKANQEAIEKARQETEANLQQQHKELQQSADKAQKKLDEATANAKQLAEQLENLRADRKMSNFIRQRQQSSDYTKYLGVIARARNDFEQLSTLLAKEQERAEHQRKKRAAAADIVADKTADPAEAECLLPPIDRIILYIDDLDRCPEDKVVDVLQAVHLLLAFPLFVVVVGVDPRWLLHSLRQHSKAFQDQGENGDATGEERMHWRSTPLNYLEKIFQIPFTLRPMGESGFGKMIETLTKPSQTDGKETEDLKVAEPNLIAAEVGKPEAVVTQTTAQSQPSVPVSKEPPAVAAPQTSWTTKFFRFLKRSFGKSGESADTAYSESRKKAAIEIRAAEQAATVAQEPPQQGAAQSSPVEPSAIESGVEKQQAAVTEAAGGKGAEDIEPRPVHLLINTWEQNFMKELHELVPSPRATKRFINIYRLIRASVDLDEKLQLDEFTGKEGQGKYRPVLMLLAILTGYPDQATEILRELLEQEHPESWWEFIDSFNARAEKGRAAASAVTAVDEREAAAAGAAGAKENGGDNAATPGDAINLLSDADAENWKQLLEKLQNLRHLFKPSEPCADFVEWAPKVARYSFQSGRVLLTRGIRNSETETSA
jgi:hypothetical protein